MYKILAIKLQPVEVVWTRHNYRTHDQDVPNWVGDLVLRFMDRMSHHQVVHSKVAADEMGYRYLPHPLYQVGANSERVGTTELPIDLSNRVAVLGQIRPSKGIDRMLESVPADVPMVIAGQPTSQAYEQKLRMIIETRQLDVVLISQQLDATRFNEILSSSRAVYIANPDRTMIVSGVFFHAASLGVPVIANDSAFAREFSDRCSFLWPIRDLSELSTVLSDRPIPPREQILAEAERLFGAEAFATSFSQLFTS